MEIHLFDEEFGMEGFADNPVSIIWHRKYYDVGDFEIHLPETYRNLIGLPYLRIPGFQEFGLIETSTWNPETRTVVLAGPFWEKTLEDSVIPTMQNFTGRPEAIIQSMMQNYYDPPIVQDELEYAPLSEIGDPVTSQLGESTLKSLCYELAQLEEQSISVNFQLDNSALRKFLFQVQIW
ncbi:MAG: siphovirus ReqiPepy6 Gp37-like family protein, partial [Clostridiales bacterium]|nr:siphovirus ReqiPepy6 Gp37-like family protein [Clostridiales bacterium]